MPCVQFSSELRQLFNSVNLLKLAMIIETLYSFMIMNIIVTYVII